MNSNLNNHLLRFSRSISSFLKLAAPQITAAAAITAAASANSTAPSASTTAATSDSTICHATSSKSSFLSTFFPSSASGTSRTIFNATVCATSLSITNFCCQPESTDLLHSWVFTQKLQDFIVKRCSDDASSIKYVLFKNNFGPFPRRTVLISLIKNSLMRFGMVMFFLANWLLDLPSTGDIIPKIGAWLTAIGYYHDSLKYIKKILGEPVEESKDEVLPIVTDIQKRFMSFEEDTRNRLRSLEDTRNRLMSLEEDKRNETRIRDEQFLQIMAAIQRRTPPSLFALPPEDMDSSAASVGAATPATSSASVSATSSSALSSTASSPWLVDPTAASGGSSSCALCSRTGSSTTTSAAGAASDSVGAATPSLSAATSSATVSTTSSASALSSAASSPSVVDRTAASSSGGLCSRTGSSTTSSAPAAGAASDSRST